MELQNEIRYADGPKALELKSKYISLEKKTHDTFVKPKLDEAEKAQKDINLADQNVVYYETMKEKIEQLKKSFQKGRIN